MKILLYGSDNAKILEKLLEIKQKFSRDQIYELFGEIEIKEIKQYLQAVSMFGGDELLCIRVNKKTDISDDILNLLKDDINKHILIVLSENLPKNSKLFKFFNDVFQFVADEKEKVFPFLEVLSKKQSLAIRNYYKLITEKNDPVYINSMLFYQFKNILHARHHTETFAQVNPFVKSKLNFVINNFSDLECVNIIREIYSVDIKLKTTSLNSEILVLNLILKIINGNLDTAKYV